MREKDYEVRLILLPGFFPDPKMAEAVQGKLRKNDETQTKG